MIDIFDDDANDMAFEPREPIPCSIDEHALGYCDCWAVADTEPPPAPEALEECVDCGDTIPAGELVCDVCAADRASEEATRERLGKR